MLNSVAACVALCLLAQVSAQSKDTADRQAYHAALAARDPAQRLHALRTFSVQYPESKYFDAVQDEALRVLLHSFPKRTTEIEDQVRVNMENADKGLDRWQMETNEAEELAAANVALPLAQKLAEDAVRNLTEDNYGRTMARTYGQLELPLPAPEIILAQFKTARAAALVALAHVELDQGKLPHATALLKQAEALDHTNADLHALRGELALRAHHDAEALDELEQAQVAGDLTPKQQQTLENLYRAQHDGSDTGLEDALDARYKETFPAPFTPPARAPRAPGHTVLLEGFTGSSCEPCAGADTALDALLSTYRRGEVVALEWHEHNPRPDPLANPASVARASLFDAEATPEFVLDGKRIPVFGGPRDASEAVYGELSTYIEAQLARPSGVQLQLTAVEDAAGLIHATAVVKTEQEDALRTAMQTETAPWPGEKVPLSTKNSAAGQASLNLTVHFALVEDNVRYSGENGIRLHRMVVRTVNPDVGTLFPGATQTLQTSFDPAAITGALVQYLTGYETSNDRFGNITFANKNIKLRLGHLAVAAWVQDETNHRVLQAGFVQLAIDKVNP